MSISFTEDCAREILEWAKEIFPDFTREDVRECMKGTSVYMNGRRRSPHKLIDEYFGECKKEKKKKQKKMAKRKNS